MTTIGGVMRAAARPHKCRFSGQPAMAAPAARTMRPTPPPYGRQILRAMPDTLRRDNAVFHARHAAALAVLPDPERVTTIAAGVVGLVHETGSARLRRELVALRDQARGWSGTAARRELGEITASIA